MTANPNRAAASGAAHWNDTRVTWLQRIVRPLNTAGAVALHAGAAYALVFVPPSLQDGLIALGAYLFGMFAISAGRFSIRP